MTIPTDHAKIVKFIKKKERFIRPMRTILKSNTTYEMRLITIRMIIVFTAPETISAIIYSETLRGAMNILLKFLDHMFQRLPTEIEYWVIRITSQRTIPI